MKLAQIQMPVGPDKSANIQRACNMIRWAGQIDLAVLPEMFCCPYSSDYFAAYAEPAGGPVWQAMSRCAAENQVCLVAGSMPEVEMGEVLAEDVPEDGIIPEGIWVAGITDKKYTGN